MEQSNKFNRQSFDFLLTDLLPYEKGNHYTHRYFYEYLQGNKKKFNHLIKLISKEKEFFNPKWHSAPLKFKISKKEESFREISLINPFGLIEALSFIDIFENDILNIIHNKNSFSARKPNRVNKLTYKKDKNQTVYYSNEKSKEQLLISLEASGTFFKHSPFKNINQLINHRSFIYLRDKFDFLMKLDIQDCYPSIYTHSYKWLVSNKIYDSKKLSNSNSIYKNIDSFLQNINGSKTNGILVGPEISRLLAEFLFIHLDQILIMNLSEEKLFINKDYYIYRFVDDFFIFTNSAEVEDTIRNEINNLLNRFQLKINHSKLTKFNKENNVNEWKNDIGKMVSEIEGIFTNEVNVFISKANSLFSSLEDTEMNAAFKQVASTIGNLEEMTTSKKKSNYAKKKRYIDLRRMLISIVNTTKEDSLVCSYLLSTILKKIEEQKGKKFYINMAINELISFVFYVYSRKVSYTSTQKLIRILSLLIEKETPGIIEFIERNIQRFEKDIFSRFTSDWIDLILFFANYDIGITVDLIEKIKQQILKDDNPKNLATLCIFENNTNFSDRSLVRITNQLIKNKVQKLNWNDFFQDELCWWVYIFLSYPKLNRILRKEILDNLGIIKGTLRDSPSDLAKNLVLDFLLTNTDHFILWKFTNEDYYSNFYYYTKDRTVFNPDVVDQVSISR
ncbi:RNA-directed DNA polymerase [Rossellomorea sp. NS-SX7]|uniref:RNA-directed DNA polymerase n=1 Tax=Rossellomorea sp. NS-SX7 TaxID=3463856 RepID=UPI00405A004E